MKFRITSRDLMIFVIFCIVLLYLCAIGVLNLVSLGDYGKFSGLSPFRAFTPKFLPVTLTLFFIAIIIIFSSVSSVIFDKQKGRGLGIKIGDKEEVGYNRWAKEKEIKEDRGVEKTGPYEEEVTAAGIPLVNNGKEIWVDNGEYHSLIIGATGSGKSETVVKPMVNLLSRKGESMVITDPKGELYRDSANFLKSRGYNIVVLNFREPTRGNSWNPLTLPFDYYKEGNTDKAVELLEDVSLNILYNPNNNGDPFWEKTAADYFSGLALGLFQDAKKEEINLNTINYMATVGEDKFAASNFIKEYFTLKGEGSAPYTFASSTINSPTETKGGILSTFRSKIRIFATKESLSEMLSYSDFDMRAIGREKTAVFIIIHDEKTTYHSLATIFIKQCYETLIDVAQENGGKLPFRTNFILDEFANMPPLKDVTTMVTAARSRSIRFNFIIQNYAQLKQVYGAEQAETIKGNCGNTVYLISTELAALEEISKMCGEVKSKEKEKTSSTPLVTVTDLQKLELFQAIIIRWRKSPFKTKYTPNYKMDWGQDLGLADYPTRDKQNIAIFELKEFVKEKKRSKMLDSLNSSAPAEKPSFSPRPVEQDIKPVDSFSQIAENKSSNPFGGNFDLDAMMRDIDKKIAELDAEEARQKASIESKMAKPNSDISNSNSFNLNGDIKSQVVMEPVFSEPEVKKDIPQQSFNLYDDVKNEGGSSTFNINNFIDPEPSFGMPIATIDDESDDDIEPIVNLVEEKKFITPKLEEQSFNLYDQYQKEGVSKQVDLFSDVIDEEVKPVEKEVIKPIVVEKPIIEESKVLPIHPSVTKNVEQVKPKINIDADSIIVNDNVISDDEFFDDFFGDD